MSPAVTSSSTSVQSTIPLAPFTTIVVLWVKVKVSYLASVETLYAKVRWVFAVAVKIRERVDCINPLGEVRMPSLTDHCRLEAPSCVSAFKGKSAK